MAPRNFIHSPPKNWNDDISTLNKTKFFLLSTIGPTVFILKGDDMTNKTFKVYIGENQRCSCGGGEGRDKLCIHLLYVMIKVLKVEPKNPLSWQLSLTDIEIDKILTNEHTSCRRLSGGSLDSANTKKYHSFLKKGQGKSMVLSKNTSSADDQHNDDNNTHDNNCNLETIIIEKEARSIENDPLCSICQEEMLQSDVLENTLCHCIAGCGSNFHTKCFKMYATYTKSDNKKSVIVCPMCRTNWKDSSKNTTTNNTMSSNMTEQKIIESGSKNIALLPTVKCRECKIVIRTTFFRCVRCVMPYDLCRRCFHTVGSRSTTTITAATKPSTHNCSNTALPLLFVKGEVLQYPIQWTAAIIPRQKKRNTILKSHRISELQQRDLNDSDYNYLLSLDGDKNGTPPKLHEHLLNALESIKTNMFLKSTEGANGHECALCLHSVSIEANLKRISCPKRHLVHESCALNMFIEADSTVLSSTSSASYYCTVCGQDALLFPALRREPKRGGKKPSSFPKNCGSDKQKSNTCNNKKKDASEAFCSSNLDDMFNEWIIGRTVFKPGERKAGNM